MLDGLPDDSGELDADDLDGELPDEPDCLLSEDGGTESIDEGGEDGRDESLLRESDECDRELSDGDDRLSDALERDDGLSEPLDCDDE